MLARLKYAKQLFSAGLYEKRGAVALLASVASWIIAGTDLLMQVRALPVSAVPPLVAQWITVAGPWVMLLGVVANFILAQSKKVLPVTPLTGAPSLLDDESDPQ